MTLDEALQNPNVNVFDIERSTNGVKVRTFAKPNDSIYTYNQRHQKNIIKAEQLTGMAVKNKSETF